MKDCEGRKPLSDNDIKTIQPIELATENDLKAGAKAGDSATMAVGKSLGDAAGGNGGGDAVGGDARGGEARGNTEGGGGDQGMVLDKDIFLYLSSR